MIKADTRGADRRGAAGILGWSLFAIEAMRRAERDFVVVAPPVFEPFAQSHGIPFVAGELSEWSAGEAARLAGVLEGRGVTYTVPLYETTVEWCGAIDAILRDEPEFADWVHLLRNKAMMKRRAQLYDIPVGVFREVKNAEEVVEFLDHVNEALLSHEPIKPVHIKAFDDAGCRGHFVIREPADVEKVPEQTYPCLAESDLEGQEIACEVFVHDGEIAFMNISEYVHLGHSVFVPPSPGLEARREEIRRANQQLIDAFEIRRGFIHPEWFLAEDGAIHFGEVAYRVPGGNAFELIERAYGFSAYEAQALCLDPATTREEVRRFFPDEGDYRGHAGVLLVYPDVERVDEVVVPDALLEDPAFESHDLILPATREVPQHDYFVNGTHWGNVYFFSDDPDRIRRLCTRFEGFDFYR